MDTCAGIRFAGRGHAATLGGTLPTAARGPGPAGPVSGCALVVALAGVAATGLATGLAAPAAAQEREVRSDWVVPRTPHGHPDLQGNWTNATVTPIQRPRDQGPVHTWEAVARIEGFVRTARQRGAQDSDPNRSAPPVGGIFSGDARRDAASGGTGGYNSFYIDAGELVAVFNGEPRTSLVVHPDNGRLPELTEEGRGRAAERRRFRSQFGSYDNPENRPLAERCIMSFGSNAGPPMLPNYFYNNNYTIVQTPDHVMIMTEMVHDVRIIRLGERRPLPPHIRPWMGDSWGRWEGDTLVVETTNLHPDQTLQGIAPSEEFKVIERFTRADEHTINYEFTVEDPIMWSEAWRGEVPFKRLDGLVYEYACHEGNYALENVLRGARAQERQGRQERR